MKNRVIVSVYVPRLETSYDVFIPIGRKVKSVIRLCSKVISEISGASFLPTDGKRVFNKKTGEEYDLEIIIKDTDIRNGTTLILL